MCGGGSFVCRNGGRCSISTEDVHPHCVCASGYDGKYCENNLSVNFIDRMFESSEEGERSQTDIGIN